MQCKIAHPDVLYFQIDAKTKSEMTYGQLVTAVRHVRCGLYKQGVLKGDVVLILLPNCMEYPVIFHSIISLGGVVTTCSPDMPPGTFAVLQQFDKQ